MTDRRTDSVDDTFLAVRERAVDQTAVLDIVFDRPAKLNALPHDSVAALISVIESSTDETADVVVLSGAGDHFCAGADVAELEAMIGDQTTNPAESVHAVVEAMRECPLPIIASVSGGAFGLGFLICMAADIVIADAGAEFGLQEVKLGIPVAGYASVILPLVVGEHRARDWLFTGRTIDAAEAEASGFANLVVPSDDLPSAVEGYVRELGTGSSLAIRLLKGRMAAPVVPGDPEAVRSAELADAETAFDSDELTERLGSLRS